MPDIKIKKLLVALDMLDHRVGELEYAYHHVSADLEDHQQRIRALEEKISRKSGRQLGPCRDRDTPSLHPPMT
jgi:hypothetical protein